MGFLAGFQPSTVVHQVTSLSNSPNPGCNREKVVPVLGMSLGLFLDVTLSYPLSISGGLLGVVFCVSMNARIVETFDCQSRKGTPMLNYLTFSGRVVGCVDINDQLHSDGQVIIKSVGDRMSVIYHP